MSIYELHRYGWFNICSLRLQAQLIKSWDTSHCLLNIITSWNKINHNFHLSINTATWPAAWIYTGNLFSWVGRWHTTYVIDILLKTDKAFICNTDCVYPYILDVGACMSMCVPWLMTRLLLKSIDWWDRSLHALSPHHPKAIVIMLYVYSTCLCLWRVARLMWRLLLSLSLLLLKFPSCTSAPRPWSS